MMPTVNLAQEHDALTRAVFADEMRRWGNPEIGPEVAGNVPSLTARPYVARTISRVPDDFQFHLLTEYRERFSSQGEQAANKWIREGVDCLFNGHSLDIRSSDEDLRDLAKEKAREVFDLLGMSAPITEETARVLLLNLCAGMGIKPPDQKNVLGMMARMTGAKWWRRTLRRETMRRREEAAIKTGRVHRKAGCYVSDETMRRLARQAIWAQKFIDTQEMVNEEGEAVALADIIESGQANPANRFIEMMIECKGMEAVADEMGWLGMMATLTCPSRMHARHWKSSRPNRRYDGTTPRQSNDHLQAQWKLVRAVLAKAGIEFMGVRVVEPHHDGTAHWHLLIFFPEHHRKAVEAAFIEYYLERFDPNEPEARERRVKFDRIDKAKGSAAAYISKYISKNIGGRPGESESLMLDFEADGLEAGETWKRATVWARVHGVRQFQPFGTAKVTIRRELRRLRQAPPEPFRDHHNAADSPDFAAFIKIMEAAPMKLWTEEVESVSYPGEMVRRIRGVELNGKQLETRTHTWVLRQKEGVALTWTRVNNCNRGALNRPGNRPERGGWGGNRHSFHPGFQSGSDHASPDLHK